MSLHHPKDRKPAQPGAKPPLKQGQVPDFVARQRKILHLDLPREQFEQEKRDATWGTYGRNADQPLEYRKLTDCTTEHLEMILYTQDQVKPLTRQIILSILRDRWEAEFAAEVFLDTVKPDDWQCGGCGKIVKDSDTCECHMVINRDTGIQVWDGPKLVQEGKI
jgi:hypothetical protein